MAGGGTRRLKIDIISDVDDAVRDTEKLADAVEDLGDSSKKSSKNWEKLDKKVDRSSGTFRIFGKTAKQSIAQIDTTKLERQIGNLKNKVAGAQIEVAKTQDMKLFRDIAKDTSTIRKLEQTKKAIESINESSKGRPDQGILSKITGSLKGSLKGAIPSAIISEPLVSGAIAAAPLVSAAVSGALTAGVALAGVGAGIAIAFQDPRVKESAAILGTNLKGVFTRSAEDFVPATTNAFGIINDSIRKLEPQFHSFFGTAATYVEPLTRGITGFVEAIMPALNRAMTAAKPVIDEIATWGPRLGESLGSAFDMFAQNAQDGAAALHDLMSIIQGAIWVFAAAASGATTLYSTLREIVLLATGVHGVGDALLWLNGQLGGGAQQFRMLSQPANTTATSLGYVDTEAKQAAQSLTIMTTAIGKLAAASGNVIAGQIAVRDAVRGAQQAFKDNGKAAKEGTPAYDANVTALKAVADAANQSAQNVYDQTGSFAAAAAESHKARSSFVAVATSMLGSSSAAKELADKLFGIPDADPKVTMTGASEAKAQAQDVANALAGLHDKTVTVYVRQQGNFNNKQGAMDARDNQNKASGGWISGPGTATSDSIPAMLSNGEYVIKASAARRLGAGRLNHLNSTGELPRFRNGGHVSHKKAKKHKAKALPTVSRSTKKALYAGNYDKVSDASASILDDLTGRIKTVAAKQFNTLKTLAKRREAMAERLNAAKDKLADAIAKRDDYKASVKASAIQNANITKTGDGEVTNADLILANLRTQLDKTNQFRALLGQLQKMNINQTSYQQIVDAGVDGGFATAQALVNGGSGAIYQLNDLQNQLNRSADGLGSDASKRLYQAGVDSAQGLVNGLNSQNNALARASKKLADTILQKLRTVLKIKSPSRVMADEVGAHMATGVALGISRESGSVSKAMTGITNPSGFQFGGVRSRPVAPATAVNVTVNVQGNVTAEKDLARSIATAVRDEIVRKGRNNGGRTGL